MFLHYYDISPGLIGIIIWGIISFLSGKGKRKRKFPKSVVPDSQNQIDNNISINQFNGVLDPQPPFNFINNNENIDNDLDKIIPKEGIVLESDANIGWPHIDKDSHSPNPKRKDSISLSFLKGLGNLQKGFILKEILDKPIALRDNGR
jgi:hypothetical protein